MKQFEIVLRGHPDKVADQIAEAIKELYEPHIKTAIEVVWFNDKIIIGGEVGGLINPPLISEATERVLSDLNYPIDKISIEINLIEQSTEIARVVGDYGAGDNGIFFAGYNSTFSPIISDLKQLGDELSDLAEELGYRTDGKFIATYHDDGTPKDFTLNIASYPHKDEDRLYEILKNHNTTKDFYIEINPRGDWELCGGFADSGLTGRKLACDNSLGLFHQGGGAFFGKDVSKADYSVPLYLHHRAREYAIENNLEEIELQANTIIGDQHVHIYDTNGNFIETVEYIKIKNHAIKNKMKWYGLE